jgi:DNA-binding FrmR family transcriptional regulator
MPTNSYSNDQEELLRRLIRIEGQARGIQKMVQDERYCVDILQQIGSMQAAADSVAMLLLTDHVKGCVANGLRSGDESRVDEVVTVIKKYLKR